MTSTSTHQNTFASHQRPCSTKYGGWISADRHIDRANRIRTTSDFVFKNIIYILIRKNRNPCIARIMGQPSNHPVPFPLKINSFNNTFTAINAYGGFISVCLIGTTRSKRHPLPRVDNHII